MTAFLRAPPSPLLTPTLPLSRALFGRTPVSRHNVHSTFTVPRPVFPHSSGPLDRCFSTVPNFQTRRQASENHRPPTQRNCQKTNNPGGIGVDELIALGQQHVLADELESAVRAFEHAEKLAPCSVVVKAELGRALVRSGRREAGFNILVDAFKIDSLYTGIKDGFREYYRVEIEVGYCDHGYSVLVAGTTVAGANVVCHACVMCSVRARTYIYSRIVRSTA